MHKGNPKQRKLCGTPMHPPYFGMLIFRLGVGGILIHRPLLRPTVLAHQAERKGLYEKVQNI